MPKTPHPTAAKPVDHSPAWQALEHEAQRFSDSAHPAAFDLRQAFAHDAQRQQKFSRTLHDAQGVLLHTDCSKSFLDDTVWQLLLQLANQREVFALRDAMFSGAAINTSEQRQVMHWLLRAPDSIDLPSSLHAAWQEVKATQDAFLAFAESVRTNAAITDIVNIGIGGSDLGPAMAVQALHAHTLANKRFHFVSNVDGHSLQEVLNHVRPASTLFIISSKSFSTLETMTNARTALQWFTRQSGKDAAPVDRHFVGITTNTAAAAALGIHTTFGFWDWVGGRYSLWSAIGLPLAIAIGADGFRQLLASAHAVDRHFVESPPENNLPLLLGLLQVWESSLLRHNSRCIAPYHADLQRLPAYLQQLEMESNGKSVTRDGQPVNYPTAPTVWGEPGSNGQHAFFQLLRQGTQTIPVEFIAVRQEEHDWPEHQILLLSNALAQAHALMLGNDHADPQKRIAGNRPSTFIVLPELTPRTLGALLALYEHRTFVCGAVWNLNSFDQWGVEQGKILAQDIAQRWQTGDVSGLDPSTAHLLQKLRN
ncbi:MAG: glucose-6-phosphate isomerase [Brachymonas sp.]|nr:glucose-6-phosphate isomerase [Brachymonas sp.]